MMLDSRRTAQGSVQPKTSLNKARFRGFAFRAFRDEGFGEREDKMGIGNPARRERRLSSMRAQIPFVLLPCLLTCGCGKTKSTDELIGDLKSAQDRDRIIAARLLPQRKGDAAQIVPALIESLKDKQDDVRWSAAIGLGSFREQAQDAIPALQAAQRDRDTRVREAAGVALSRIDPARFPSASKARPAEGK
jgi:hypothetical protein